MPTVLRTGPYRFFFFSNEGTEPPHVHVESSGGYAKLWLDVAELVEVIGYGASDIRRIRLTVIEHRRLLMGRWHEHFGSS
ncbi:MAG: DUF4160 domain-containing protein [Actinobacteria bacterium]|nr:DUF4160 domain-containing protein [Actinomycetota bacterium]